MDKQSLILNGSPLIGPDVVSVARKRLTVSIGDEALQRMQASRSTVEKAAASATPTYSINTG